MNSLDQDFIEDTRTVLNVNDLLRVHIPDDPDPVRYLSRIEDISEGKLVMAWPTSRGIRLAVHRDQILELSFVRDGGAFSFNGLVDQTNLDPLPQITVIQSSAVMHIQRRQDFRFKCLIPLKAISVRRILQLM